MNESDEAEWQRSIYRNVLKALDEAHFWLERIPAEGADERDAERSGAGSQREGVPRERERREETSIQRAQNFGKRIGAKDNEGIWIPTSYAVNRALVLGTQAKNDPVDSEHKT